PGVTRLELEWGKHHPAVFGVAYRLFGTVADAEDVVQDVWLRANSRRRMDSYGPGAGVRRSLAPRRMRIPAQAVPQGRSQAMRLRSRFDQCCSRGRWAVPWSAAASTLKSQWSRSRTRCRLVY
ncbi:MAG: hypothetical protein QOG05_3894, partial [Streptosporangiaceae bacterium]|nr:hypothetical protein [Streptosporangiaceae bacterium]